MDAALRQRSADFDPVQEYNAQQGFEDFRIGCWVEGFR